MNRRTFLKLGVGATVALGAGKLPALAPVSVKAFSYNRQAVVNYARAYATNGGTKRNNQFPSLGNDCTNFASQCALAGGLSMRGGPSFLDRKYDNLDTWYAKNTIVGWFITNTWSEVTFFRLYMERNEGASIRIYGTDGDGLAKLRTTAVPGDFVQVIDRPTNNGEHTVVVTKKENGEIFFTSHSGPGGKDYVDTALKTVAGRIQGDKRFALVHMP